MKNLVRSNVSAEGFDYKTQNSYTELKNAEIYISYKWENGKMPALVRYLFNEFKRRGYNIHIDVQNIETSNDEPLTDRKINQYMQELGNSKYIVALINHNYLKSRYCMYEILETLKYPDVHHRIYPIILEDAQIENKRSMQDYVSYWEIATSELMNSSPISTNPLEERKQKENIELFNDIRKVFPVFFEKLEHMNILREDELALNQFEKLFDIIDKAIEADITAVSHDNQLPVSPGNSHFAKKINHVPFYNHEQLIGRVDLLADIHSKFQSQQSHITVINGIGGIGKTTLALAYINNAAFTNQYQHIAWVDSTDNIRDSMLQELENSTTDFSYNLDKTPEENFKLLLKSLRSMEGDNLLVIDNANNSKDLTKVKKQLKQLGWNILITSREQPAGYDFISVDELAPGDALALFYRYYKRREKVDEKIVRELLKKIDYHTLLIELLAKSATKNNQLTVERLFQIISTQHLNARDLQAGVHIEHKLDARSQLKEHQIYAYINSMFSFSRLDKISKRYLRFFSILPSKLEHPRDLCIFFQIKDQYREDFLKVLHQLSGKGWLITENGYYKAHPLIQTVVREQLKPNTINCQKIVQTFSDKFFVEVGKNPLNKRAFIPYGESILNVLKGKNTKLANLFDNFAKTLRYFGDYERAIKCALQGCVIREDILDRFDTDIWHSYVNISVIYRYMGKLKKSLVFGNKSLRFLNKLPHTDYVKFATSYYKLTLTYLKIGNFKKALECSDLDLMSLEKGLKPGHPYFAETYNTRGEIYRQLGDFDKALKYKQKALHIRLAELEEDHPDLAISYHHMALTYFDRKEYSLAFEHIIMAVGIRTRILPENHPDLLDSLNWQKKINEKYFLSQIRERNGQITDNTVSNG